jgi:hypothetical protein
MAEQGQQTVRESNYTEKHKKLYLASRTTETSRKLTKFYCTDSLSELKMHTWLFHRHTPLGAL